MTQQRVTTRDLAIAALVRVEGGAYSNVLLPTMLRDSSLDVRDRAFTTDIVYGTLREQRALDWLLARSLDRSMDAIEPAVRAGLRLGAYQLVHGVPAHAAVGETVEAVAAHQPRARGFVNAVLRATARIGPPWPWPEGDDVVALAIRTSHPDWIVDELVATVDIDAARDVLEADNRAPGVTLRVNPSRTTVDALAAELAAAGVAVEHGALLPDALVVRGSGDPRRLPAVAEGRATPQDQGSQAIVALLDPQPGERVLDVAAAPGGKSTGIAERVGDHGRVIALDVHAGRVRLITEAARRLGLHRVSAVVADGRHPPHPDATFDRVLVDAPCTGLGVLRRRPEARWRVQQGDAARLAVLQREMLLAAAPLVRPLGRLVYSVCTMTTNETRGVDDWAAEALPGFRALDPPGPPWRPWGRGALLLPGVVDTDGMYVLVLEASTTPPAGTLGS